MSSVTEFDPRLSPLDVASRLRTRPGLLFLDSARSEAERAGRYSYVMADPVLLLSVDAAGVRLTDVERGASVLCELSALEVCDAVLRSAEERRSESFRPRFHGGWAGFFGYEFGAALEGVSRGGASQAGLPDCQLGWYSWVFVWDWEAGRAWLEVHESRPDPLKRLSAVSGALGDGGFTSIPQRAINLAERRAGLLALLAACSRGEEVEDPRPPRGEQLASAKKQRRNSNNAEWQNTSHPVPGWPPSIRSDFSRPEFESAVARVRALILAGDIFQANISQEFCATWPGDPWDLYLRLRAENPAPFAAYLALESGAILSASPEMFLEVHANGTVVSSPIKGTRPRADDHETDSRLARELLESNKDRAENLMIVDLLRNDLSRVCLPGSVFVPELFALQRSSTVQHLVSTVQGQLGNNARAVDVVRAALPGGSITGAPKIRAMQIIAEVEARSRGVYCGSLGYFSVDGAAMFNIAIRTMTLFDETVRFAAGGGIVADSDPASEYLETLSKGAGIVDALEGGGRLVVLDGVASEDGLTNLAPNAEEEGALPR